MKKNTHLSNQDSTQKQYQKPVVSKVKLDTQISLSMVSVPPNPWNAPQMPQSPEGIVQRIFKLRW